MQKKGISCVCIQCIYMYVYMYMISVVELPELCTDNLMYELLQNYTEMSSKGFSVVLLGNFNGRCLKRCDFTKLNVISDLPSYNGTRLRQFVEASELSNTFYTRTNVI